MKRASNLEYPFSLTKLYVAAIIFCGFCAMWHYALPSFPLLGIFFVILFYAIPLTLVYGHISVIKKTERFMTLSSDGIISRFFGGRLLLNIKSYIISIILSYGIVLSLFTFEIIDFILLFISLCIYIYIHKVVFRRLKNESIDWLCGVRTLKWSMFLSIIISFLLQFVIVFILYSILSAEYAPTLEEAVKTRAVYTSKSDVLNFLLDYISVWLSTKQYIVTKFDFELIKHLLLTSVIQTASFFIFLNVFSIFLITNKEKLRMFVEENIFSMDIPKPHKNIGWLSFFYTIITFMLLFVLAISEELFIEHRIEDYSAEQMVEKYGDFIYALDNKWYSKELLASIKAINKKYGDMIQQVTNEINAESDFICVSMKKNVDNYLDWYFSLTGDYFTLGNVLIGNGEEYLNGILKEHLEKNIDKNKLDNLNNELDKINAQWKKEIESAKQKFEVPPEIAKKIRKTRFPAKMLKEADDKWEHVLKVKGRALTSTGIALLSGKIAYKAMSKPATKVATKVFVKFAAKVGMKGAGALGGAGAGATTGAAVGSFVPGVGTAVGAAIGGLVGAIGAWVLTDELLITADELLNRDEMRKEILEAIDEECK